MKLVWSGCHTAQKYLVLYLKLNHCAFVQIQLCFSFPRDHLYIFGTWTDIFMFSSVIANPNSSLSPVDTGLCKYITKNKTKSLKKNLSFVLWNTHIVPLKPSWMTANYVNSSADKIIYRGARENIAPSHWQCDIFFSLTWASVSFSWSD